MELWIGRTPLLLQYNNCNGLNLLFWMHFFKLKKEAHMGNYPYKWFSQMKECSKPLNLSFAKRKQNLCLQRLVVLPLLGIPQLCFLANHHQPRRMAACTTICTGSGHGTKATIPAVITMEKENSRGKRQYPKSSGGTTEAHTFVLQNIHGINSL